MRLSPLRLAPLRAVGAAVVSLVIAAGLLATPDASAVLANKAAGPTYHRINGNPAGQSGLQVWQGGCTAQGTTDKADDFAFGYGNGEPFPYGPLSVAWTPDRVDNAVALRAYTADPGAADIFDVQVFHPNRNVGAFVTVSYIPDAAGIEEWLGYASFTDNTAGWHPVRASSSTYTWLHLVNGVSDGEVAAPSTLAAMAARVGTERDEARMGFAFGCTGEVVYVDGLRLGSSKQGWDVYDLVGRPSDISLRVSREAKSCQVSATSYPSRIRVSGRVTGLQRWAIWRLDDKGRIVRRISKTRTSRKGPFQELVPIKRSAAIVAYAQNTDTTEAAVSKAIRVSALPQVDFSAGSRSTVLGRSLSVAGRVKAGGRLRYTALYTHWTGKSWTPFRAVGKGRTQANGSFRVTAPAGATGYSRLSILTKASKKVNAALSRSAVTYRVSPRATRGPRDFGDSNQPTSTSNGPAVAPAPTPVQPGGGNDNEPAPIPEPGRVVVQKSTSGFGVCGWKPPSSRP